MKEFVKINAYLISENSEFVDLKINIHETGITALNVSSLIVNRKNLSAFRQDLLYAFNTSADLFIFEIELPSIISKQVIRRINQYIPKKIPAVILAKPINSNNEPLRNNNFIKILINTPENVLEQQKFKNVISNFWDSIIYNN